MIRIGDFSKLCHISIRMLRHYDDMGLLKPEQVDNFTGYRYYDHAQLQTANRITALKDMGFSLAAIAEIMNEYHDPKSLAGFLAVKLSEIQEQERETKNRLTRIESAIKRLREDERSMKYDVTLKTMPERTVISLRKIIPSYDKEGMLWQQMMNEVGNNLPVANPCYALAVFHDEGYKESDVDVEIQMAVQIKQQDSENVVFKSVPSQEIASSIYQGSYEQIMAVNETVATWISDNGYDYNGPMFTIYHISPAQDPNPENWVTEICYPVKKKS